jgi:hypothetical protein
VKNTVAAHMQRSRMLLELAKSRAGQTRIRWRSEDLGPWESVNPQWSVLGGRIRFQFHDRGRLLSFWAAAVRHKAGGISISLKDSRGSLPELFEMHWDEPDCDSVDPSHLWAVAKHWLTLEFPRCRIIRAVRRPDLARTLSGSFLRVLFHHRGENRLLIAADEGSGDEAHRAVGQALLWLLTLGSAPVPKLISAAYILVPSGTSAVLCHRCRFLNRGRINAEVWEYVEKNLDTLEFQKAAAPSEPKEDRDFRWPVLGPFRWSSPLQRVLDLAPELIRRYPRFHDYDSLRLWGLEFAQVTGPARDRILFGVGPQRTELTEDNFELVRSLVEEIVIYRRPDGPDSRHPYYRLQAERWLEALVLEAIPRLFPEMAPESVYSQIPVYLGPDSGRVDILGADRLGTLVVMELKVAADPDLPIQALDYWGRVIRHNENGDFERRGYFSEVRLTRRRPRIYLVSPVFSFHDTTELLLHYLEPDLEVWKIAINEDWRCGVKIIRRVQCKLGEL